ncbi:MAG: N-acetyltransferase, partial [Sulfurimicrobium sp.]
MAKIEVVPVAGRARLNQFVALPKELYRGHAGFVAPLDMERRDVLSTRKNPYFTHAEAELFLALREGQTVGRVSAQICRLEQEKRPGTGHFGWLDAIDDGAVYAALLEAAAGWLRERGMNRMVGPFSFSSNEETGLLVEGFESRPMLMMPYHARHAGGHVERAGLVKLKDVIAYEVDEGMYKPMGSSRMLQKWQADGTVRLRGLDMNNYARDLRVILDIFNDAWSQNWGMVPFTE